MEKTERTKPVLRSYEAVIRSPKLSSKDGQKFVVKTANRREAVNEASQIFWKECKNTLGPIKGAMTVSDPYGEAVFTEDIDCRDILFKLLPVEVIEKIVTDSNGQLVRDEKVDSPYCLKRLKRRRDFGKFIAPGIRLMKNGTLYYRVVKVPQQSKDGVVIQKRVMVDIKLEAKNLEEAVAEIATRKLNVQVLRKARLKKKERRIEVLRQIVKGIEFPEILTPQPTTRKFVRRRKNRPKKKPKSRKLVLQLRKVMPLSAAARALLQKPVSQSGPVNLWANSKSEREGWSRKGAHKVVEKPTVASRSIGFDEGGRVAPKFTDKGVVS